MKIENQNIYGGNQQFADIIINSKENSLDETDRKLIALIHNNTNSDKERIDLLKSLDNIKNENSNSKEMEGSKKLLNKFLDSSVGEAGKQIVKELIENGVDYLQILSI